MELVIEFGFVSREHNIDFSGEIDVHTSAVDLWMNDINDLALLVPPTLAEAVQAEILKAFALSYDAEMRQVMAEVMDWEECFYIHNVRVADTTTNSNEPVMSFDLNAETVVEVVNLYEWLDPESRTNWSGAVAWLAYHEENSYSIEYSDFDKWLEDNYCGTYDSLEKYASAHDIYIPWGCSITDEDEFLGAHGDECIILDNGDYIIYFQ